MFSINHVGTARGLISLSIRCVEKKTNSVGIPQNFKFTFTRSLISGSLDKVGREWGLQPELLKGEINNSEITKYIYNVLRHILELYLESDVLDIAFVSVRHSMEMQKKTKKAIKKFLTEASLGWKGFGFHNKDRHFYTSKNEDVRTF